MMLVNILGGEEWQMECGPDNPQRKEQEAGSRGQEAGRPSGERARTSSSFRMAGPGRLRLLLLGWVGRPSCPGSGHPQPSFPGVIICSCLSGLWPSADTWPAACGQLKTESAWGGRGEHWVIPHAWRRAEGERRAPTDTWEQMARFWETVDALEHKVWF